MAPLHRPFLILALLSTPLCAQRVWIVDEWQGPGTDFRDLPPAVAAASSGDFIYCRPGAYSGFVTAKGLNIRGDAVISGEIVVRGLPAREAFTMVGFDFARGQEAIVTLESNQGFVTLENVGAVETGFMGIGRSFRIADCVQVALTDCYGFGTPAAVVIERSRVLLSRCQLGVSRIGLGHGTAVICTDSDVEIVEPRFDAGRLASGNPAIVVHSSRMRVVGSNQSYIQGAGASGAPAAPAFAFTHLTQVVISTAIGLNPFVAGPATSGPGVLVRASPMGTMSEPLVPGQNAVMTAMGPPLLPAALVIGSPALPFPLPPLGTILIDSTRPFAAVGLFLSQQGVGSITVPVPASIPPAVALALQALTLFEIGLAHVAVIR